MDHPLGSTHFLSLPRPDIFIGLPLGVPDTTTLAAHDFDVDTRTGFMPPQPPLRRLPAEWECWEAALEFAITHKLKLGETLDLTQEEKDKSESWRQSLRELRIMPIDGLKQSEVILRRAHLVLAWILHFYVHSLPPTEPIRIPPSITLPLLQVSAQLQLPPVLTYSDDVLYNWHLDNSESGSNGEDEQVLPTESTIRCTTSFTSTDDEAEFYLTSGRMELAGVEALELMRSTMDEAFVGDDIAVRRITEYLNQLVIVIKRLKEMLLDVRKGCDPQVFYNDVRPWFRGEDSVTQGGTGRKWVFEGMEMDPTLTEPEELSGPSAGQSALIHAMDIFLGVDKYSHDKELTGKSTSSGSELSSHSSSSSQSSSSSAAPPTSTSEGTTHDHKSAFLKRMQLYMPRHHRAFLNHLSNNPRPLRNLVLDSSSPGTTVKGGKALLQSYNEAIMALKEFRDAHMIIVTLYIINPARLARLATEKRQSEVSPTMIPGMAAGESTLATVSDSGRVSSTYVTETSLHSQSPSPLKGTGGTDLVRFLKDVRDQTKGALLSTLSPEVMLLRENS